MPRGVIMLKEYNSSQTGRDPDGKFIDNLLIMYSSKNISMHFAIYEVLNKSV